MVLASVVAALAVYQLVLIAIGYGKVRPPVPGPHAASFAHRFSGGVIATLVTVVALMCISYFGFEEDESAVHMVAGAALLGVLAVKVWVVRRGERSSRYLPHLGITVFLLIALTWASSAGDFLSDR